MKRDLARMAECAPFDVLVIGGGITGAAVAWDAALRGFSVALVEKKDFACGTSSATSKLIHGGLRYLQQYDFALVRESLRERQAMMRITPHQVTPLRFAAPTLRWGGTWGMGALALAALGYNALSLGGPAPASPDKKLPHARVVRAATVRRLAPALRRQDWAGGLLYHDAQMYDTARHTLEFVLSAAERGAQVANYAEVTSLLVEEVANGRRQVCGARVRDVRPSGGESGDTYDIRARITVSAAGPWADALLADAKGSTSSPRSQSQRVVRSKGIHLITRSLTGANQALILHASGGRHVFVIPWRGHSLVGTTDTAFEGDPDDPLVTEADLRELLDTLNTALPSAGVTRADVGHFYGGLRPLVSSGSGSVQDDTYGASRRYEIEDYADAGIGGFFAALGGKYTTSRSLAETLVDRVSRRLDQRFGRSGAACRTARTPTAGGRLGAPLPRFLREETVRHAGTLPTGTVRHLARSYGARLGAVLDAADGDPERLRPLSARTPDVAAQILLAARDEMALTLEDAVLRRTGLGTLGHPGAEALHEAARLMSDVHGWSDARLRHEIAQTERAYYTADALAAGDDARPGTASAPVASGSSAR